MAKKPQMGARITLTPKMIAAAELAAQAGLFKRDIARRLRVPERTFFAWLARGRTEAERLTGIEEDIARLEGQDEPLDEAAKVTLKRLRLARGRSQPSEALCLHLLQAVEGGEGDFKLDLLLVAKKQALEDGSFALRVLAVRDAAYAPGGGGGGGGVRVTTSRAEGPDGEVVDTVQVDTADLGGATADDWTDVGELLLRRRMERNDAARARAAAEKEEEAPPEDDEDGA